MAAHQKAWCTRPTTYPSTPFPAGAQATAIQKRHAAAQVRLILEFILVIVALAALQVQRDDLCVHGFKRSMRGQIRNWDMSEFRMFSSWKKCNSSHSLELNLLAFGYLCW
jgi:hypothetical protein